LLLIEPSAGQVRAIEDGAHRLVPPLRNKRPPGAAAAGGMMVNSSVARHHAGHVSCLKLRQ